MKPPRTKYRAKKTVVDGITFASKREAARYQELKLLVRAGRISALELQPRFTLLEKFTDDQGNKHRKMEYVADFTYYDKRQKRIIVEDSKGAKTDVYKIKKKLLLAQRRDFIFIES